MNCAVPRRRPEAEGLADDRKALMRTIALAGQVGWWMVFSILGGFLLGMLLDRWLGTGVLFTIVLLLGGIVGGGWQAYRLIMRCVR